jgi:hypothetical protein
MTTDAETGTDTAPGQGGFSPPYTSWTTALNLIERMTAEGGIPSRVDRSYLSNLPGSTQTMLISGLKSLAILDQGGSPTPTLHALVNDPDGRPALVRQMLETHYKAPLALGLNATQAQLEEAFRDMGVSGSTLRKAVAFFLAAARYAELPVSPHFKTPKIGRGSNGAPRKRSSSRARGGTGGGADQSEDKPAKPDDSLDALKKRYIEAMVDKVTAEGGTPDTDLLTRVEWLLGFREAPPEGGPKASPTEGDGAVG